MAHSDIMTIASLRTFLQEFINTAPDQYQIWLSSDTDGKLLPLSENPEQCTAFNLEREQLILFPSHRRERLFGGPENDLHQTLSRQNRPSPRHGRLGGGWADLRTI